MSRLREISCSINQTLFSLNKECFGTGVIDPCEIMKYASKNNESLYIKPKILCFNVNRLTFFKASQIKILFEKFKPDIAWAMENWTNPIEINGYNLFIDKSIYKNALYVRANIIRNRLVRDIPYGLSLDNLNFRYIPPNSKKTLLYEDEYGDFNFLSNSWISKRKFVMEKRYNKLGGMGFKSTDKTQFKFIDFPSDHDAIIVQFESAWKKYLRNDKIKLENEINTLEKGKNIGYIFKNTDNYKYPRADNGKIINPIKENLNLEPWFKLYGHDPDKINYDYKPIISNGNLHKINSKAYDLNNISNKMVLDILTDKQDPKINQLFVNNNPGNFASKVVCLRKKDKNPDNVLNLRAIQISPINFKIAEQSRNKLKQWLIDNTDRNRILSFLPGLSCLDIFKSLKNSIDNG